MGLPDDDRWEDICSRNKAADGRFWYGVATTGVFCIPSCSSRRPLRQNVRFFSSSEEAEKAGFRPCLRCRPKMPPATGLEFIVKLCRLIEEAEVPPSLAELARQTGVSPFSLHKKFKAAVGITPKGYAQALRSTRLRSGLEGGSVGAVAFNAGFNSLSPFYASAPAELGMSPSVFAANGAGEEIHFAFGHCSLGRVMVAITTRGICALAFGDSDESLEFELRKKFRHARLLRGGAEFGDLMSRVVALAENPKMDHRLPLDIRGTAFQRKVWEAIQRIPAGMPSNYQEIARSVGAPDAARAVAQACGANTIAVAIPCHRVLRKDGTLSGYRWGVERKKKLLDRESS